MLHQLYNMWCTVRVRSTVHTIFLIHEERTLMRPYDSNQPFRCYSSPHLWDDLILMPEILRLSLGAFLFNLRFITFYCGACLCKLPGRNDKSIAFKFLLDVSCMSGSWVSSVGTVTKLLVIWPRYRGLLPGRKETFIFDKAMTPAVMSTQPPNHWKPGVISLDVKWLWSEMDHMHPSSVAVKNEWSYISPSSYAAMTCCLFKHEDISFICVQYVRI